MLYLCKGMRTFNSFLSKPVLDVYVYFMYTYMYTVQYNHVHTRADTKSASLTQMMHRPGYQLKQKLVLATML